MVQTQTKSRTVATVLAQTIDIDSFLSLRHFAKQSVTERDALKSLYDSFDTQTANLEEPEARKFAVQWALGIDSDKSKLSQSKHPLSLMIYYKTCEADNNYQAAFTAGEKAAKLAPTEAKCVLSQVAALRKLDRNDDALKLLDSLSREFSDCAEFSYQRGRCLENNGDYEKAGSCYQKAIEGDSKFYLAIFHLARLADLRGDSKTALAHYKSIGPGKHSAFVNAALNMALIYEDECDYENALACCRAVLKQYPKNHRAKLFYRDIEESMQMYYSPEEAKESERIESVLRVPVSDFELSVRSRNCLTKMNIKALGDLVRKSEQEMLGYKNFGETSLREIREILGSRGLRLGMLKENGSAANMFDRHKTTSPVHDNNDYDNRSLDELELSVRSRKCMDRLGIQTMGQLLSMSEAELIAAKNFGRVSLQEIKRKLAERNITLR